MPVFSMSFMVPSQSFALNIFEPRYRLMVRRAIAGSRKLIMTGYSEDGTPASVGVVATIVDYETQPDGRYSVTLLALPDRCELSDYGEVDGYRTAIAKVARDDPLEGEPLTAPAWEDAMVQIHDK